MQQSSTTAYLIIRQGSRWSDVFRLVPGQKYVVGRASSNQIVVPDERASRQHAEIYFEADAWVVRDLQSRNRTLVDGNPIVGDHVLKEGEVIQVASCQLSYVHSLTNAFGSEDLSEEPGGSRPDQQVTADHSNEGIITHRRRDATWLRSDEFDSLTVSSSPAIADERLSSKAAIQDSDAIEANGDVHIAQRLFRLAFDLAGEKSIESAAQLALQRLLALIGATAGGILSIEQRTEPESRRKPSRLSVLATCERLDKAYHRVSDFLATTVIREGQAVLARNIQDDSQLIDPQASATRQTTSVICAPIRDSSGTMGLVHVYSSHDEPMLSAKHLEIAVAVSDTLALAIRNIRRQKKLSTKLMDSQRQIRQLQSLLVDPFEMIGSSPALERVHHQIMRVGPTQATVLIRGESGVGKELAARAIHMASPRKDGPFVAINCAALTATLLESELFGHEKGSFTGATDRKIGKFEMADHGTLMLDEIGEMSAEIQAKFLRALEGKPFERLGGNKSIQVDVRVVAATNRDLEQAVREGNFRSDLYFRLRVIEIQVPALRERREDILPLANYFLERLSQQIGPGPKAFSSRAQQAMLEYAWPGNIRELRNSVERAVVLASGEEAEPEDLALSNLNMPTATTAATQCYQERSLDDIERDHIVGTLAATGGHKSRTAAILGIERSTLDRKLRKYNLSASD